MDRISREKRSWNMSRIRSTDTSLELLVRKHLFARGYRYRIHFKLPGKPDIVFPRLKIAIFVNGCFWHFHGCRLSTIPKTRTDFWTEKLKKNKERDNRNIKELEKLGWNVITLWECSLEDDFNLEMKSLEEFINAKRVTFLESTSW